jgi:hypothetical protein
MRAVLEAAGVRNVVGKILGTTNKASNVYATVEALKKIAKIDRKLKARKEKTGSDKSEKESSKKAKKKASSKKKSKKTIKKQSKKKSRKKGGAKSADTKVKKDRQSAKS